MLQGAVVLDVKNYYEQPLFHVLNEIKNPLLNFSYLREQKRIIEQNDIRDYC